MYIKLTDQSIKKIISIFLLFIITLSVFRYTIKIRKPWFGTLSDGHHQWITADTLIRCKNWYREGPLNLKFLTVEDPISIELPTLSSREVYVSYPPGNMIPIYIISKLTKYDPTLNLIMKYNLLNHFFIALFLGLTAFFLLLQLEFTYLNAFIFAIVPISLELLLPAPLYWHQNPYLSDQAVILPFILFIFLEVIRRDIKTKKMYNIVNFLQSLLLFYGTLTDWLFIFIALTVYIKRVFNNEIGRGIYLFFKKSVEYWFPSVLAVSLFILQVYSLNLLPRLIEKFLFRTGLGHGGEKYVINFFNIFWKKHIVENYGKIAIGLLWGSFFLFIISFIYVSYRYFRKRQINGEKNLLSLMGMLLIPCFTQVYFFRCHSWWHDYSTLKFSVVLALVPFIAIPILILSFLKIDLTSLSLWLKISYNNRGKEIKLSIPVLLIIILVGFYLKVEHPRFKNLFPTPNNYAEGKFISTNTQYNDVVFSPNYEIPNGLNKAPNQLSYSMKRVYQIDSILDIYDKVKHINGDFVINIFLLDQNFSNINYGIKELISISYDIRQANDFSLYKIRKIDFLKKYDELKNA